MERGFAAMIVSTAVGVWLYVAPGVLDYGGAHAASDRVAGAVIAAFSFVALWAHMRGLRVVNRAIAGWLLLSVVLFQPSVAVAASTVLSAATVLALSFVGGAVKRPYGGGWRAVVGGRPDRRAPDRSGQ